MKSLHTYVSIPTLGDFLPTLILLAYLYLLPITYYLPTIRNFHLRFYTLPICMCLVPSSKSGYYAYMYLTLPYYLTYRICTYLTLPYPTTLPTCTYLT